MLEIEYNAPKKTKCECCENFMTSLTRFVYKNGDAYAIYKINYTREHVNKLAFGIISIGDWDENSSEKDRTAFPFEISMDETNYKIHLVDKEESPWENVSFFGKILDRNESLNNVKIEEVFKITNCMLSEDKELINYFET